MMNNISILKYFLIVGFVCFLQSCSEDSDSELFDPIQSDQLAWQASTNITVSQVEGKESFIWYNNLLSNTQYWHNDVVELEMQLVSQFAKVDDFESVDFYLTAQEEDGYNYTAPYEREGLLLKTADEFTEEGEFTVSISVDEVVALFENKFQNPRSSAPLLVGDLFELFWVINNNDGTKLDSRDYFEGLYSFGFTTKHKDYAPTWIGTFDWVEIDTDGNVVPGGNSGQSTSVLNDDGTYTFDPCDFFENWGAGTITYDYPTGKVNIEHTSDAFTAFSWEISNINGSSLDIHFTGEGLFWGWYAFSYDANVRLTRTDGLDWPTNLHVE